MSVSAVLLARRLSWLLVVVLVFSAGCSGEEPVAQPPERPAPRTSPVATTEPTPEPTAEPPELPAAAQQNSKAGAVAFLYHFVDLLNYTSASGDTETFARTTTASCRSCMAITRAIDEIHSAGGRVEGGELTVRSYTQVPGQSADAWRFVVRVHARQQTVRRSSGGDVQRTPPNSARLTVDIARAAGEWKVLEMEML